VEDRQQLRRFPATRSLKGLLFSALLLLAPGLAPPAAADFAAGVAAYDRGEYAAAYQAWLPLAQGGDPAAQRNVGHLHRFGLGVAQDFERATYWYREAAEAGLAAAQANLAVMYLRGQGLAADPERAAYWFRLAAVQGHAVAQYNLGLLHLTGDGVARSEARAMAWFHLAAKAGHQQALEALSKLVLDSATLVGPSTPPGWKPPEAAPTPEKPADESATITPAPGKAARVPTAGADDVPSIDLIGAIARLFSSRDDGDAPATTVETSSANAPQDVVRDPVEFAGVGPGQPVPKGYLHKPDDQRRLSDAVVAFHAGDFEVARARLLPLARAGMAEAQYWLGLLHGRPEFEAGDRAEAFVWLTLAADRGHPEAGRARAGLMERMTSDERVRSHTLLQTRRGES